jgi:large subunit ribosomal protein L25
MELQSLTVKTRDGKGKGPARRSRRAGEIPATIYGEGKEAVSLAVDLKTFQGVVHGKGGEHAIVQLEVEGRPELNGPAVVKSVQHHPVRSHIVHADFMRIRLDARMRTVVPIVLVGRSKGVLEGGVPDQQLHELEVECLALDVPEHIEVDITELGVGESLHVSQIAARENVEIVTEGDRTVIAVHPPRVTGAAAGEAVEGAVAEAAEKS